MLLDGVRFTRPPLHDRASAGGREPRRVADLGQRVGDVRRVAGPIDGLGQIIENIGAGWADDGGSELIEDIAAGLRGWRRGRGCGGRQLSRNTIENVHAPLFAARLGLPTRPAVRYRDEMSLRLTLILVGVAAMFAPLLFPVWNREWVRSRVTILATNDAKTDYIDQESFDEYPKEEVRRFLFMPPAPPEELVGVPGSVVNPKNQVEVIVYKSTGYSARIMWSRMLLESFVLMAPLVLAGIFIPRRHIPMARSAAGAFPVKELL